MDYDSGGTAPVLLPLLLFCTDCAEVGEYTDQAKAIAAGWRKDPAPYTWWCPGCANPRMANLTAVKAAVARMQRLGYDVGLRNGYGRYGLSAADEGRDISPLLSPKELRLFVEGFEEGIRAAGRRL
jgi:hypothetical protein